jgi:phosphoglycolate phosphatase-like HAD superfamily hydrolase
MDVSRYTTLIFDCDGVVLDSNIVKTEAFYKVALPYGERAADSLVEYHKENGGISRYKKFEVFLENIVGTKLKRIELNKLLDEYAQQVRSGLLSCQISPGLEKLRHSSDSKWFVVSGGDQSELRDIFRKRKISSYFDGGIFGSPDTKTLILSREMGKENIKLPALFIGDSKYDYQVSSAVNMDFVFVYDWTEVDLWAEFCNKNNLDYISNISCLRSTAP